MKRRKILIIGGSGFIGRNLIELLGGMNYDIISVSKTSEIPGVRNIHTDLLLTNFSFLKTISPDYVIYLGTISSPKEAEVKKQQSFETNVVAIQKFLEVARNFDIKKIIFLSSAVLYKDKTDGKYIETDRIDSFLDTYNFSKVLMEKLAEFYRIKYNMKITVFRLSNTYGPYQLTGSDNPLLIPSLFKQAITNGKISVWNGKPVRDWVYVGDVANIIAKELKNKESGVYNLGTGVGHSVRQISKIIASLTNSSVEFQNKIVKPPFRLILNLKALKKHLNFVPQTTIEKGLMKTYEFYKSYYKTNA